MLALYERWNKQISKLLLLCIAIGLASSIPFIVQRFMTEQTSKQIEFIADYRDVLEISSYRGKPSEYLNQRLMDLKAAGVQSMAVYESTLSELELSGRIRVLNSEEAALLTGFGVPLNERSTYVLFLDAASEQQIRPMIEEAFIRLGVEITPWNMNDLPGIKLSMPRAEARLQKMAPDPLTMRELREMGFQLVVRLSDQRRPFDAEYMDKLLADLSALGVTRIVFDGTSVTGAADDAELNSLAAMAELMNKHGIGLATIELSAPQTGLDKLSYLTDYNVVRLHSLPENMSGMAPEQLVDRFVLAASDRNIRMFFLNSQASLDGTLGVRKDTIENLIHSLAGEQGAIAALEKRGFVMGTAQPFEDRAGLPQGLSLGLKALVTLGSVALIAMLVHVYLPKLTLLAFVLGLIGSAGLYVLSAVLLTQGLALGVGIAASTLAIVYAVRRADEGSVNSPVLRALKLLALASLISLAGIVLIVALLDHISYLYVIRQYRGVSLLHLAPIALALVYVFFFHGQTVHDAVRGIRKVLSANITVLWVIVAAVSGAVVMYYLSRTGNEGSATGFELMFRDLLQDTFGVRPRTKEFLLAHPLFILGVFLMATVRRRFGMLLVALGSIGQLSMVDTFAHLHTPLMISFIRMCLGLAFGAAAGLVLIALWRWAEKGWSRWATRQKPL